MAAFSDVLLTVDFDRTLTAPDSTIPQRNVDAISYFIANGGTKNVTNYAQPSASPKDGTLFAYIDLTACTPREAQQAEETLRGVAHKSPKEIAGTVHDLEHACRLRKTDNIAGFVREFNNHFGTNLNEQSFYSAYRNT